MAKAEWQRIRDGAQLARAPRPRSPCRPRPRLRRPPRRSPALPEIVELNIGHFLIGEAVFVGLAERDQHHARGDGSRPRQAAAARHDPRHRLRPHRHPPHRRGRSSGTATAFSTRIFTDDRARARPSGRAKPRSRPTPSASPPRRPAPRRSAPGLRAGVCWRDMGVVNLPSGRPTMQLTGGRAGAAPGASRRRATRRGSTSPSPTKGRWRRPSS